MENNEKTFGILYNNIAFKLVILSTQETLSLVVEEQERKAKIFPLIFEGLYSLRNLQEENPQFKRFSSIKDIQDIIANKLNAKAVLFKVDKSSFTLLFELNSSTIEIKLLKKSATNLDSRIIEWSNKLNKIKLFASRLSVRLRKEREVNQRLAQTNKNNKIIKKDFEREFQSIKAAISELSSNNEMQFNSVKRDIISEIQKIYPSLNRHPLDDILSIKTVTTLTHFSSNVLCLCILNDKRLAAGGAKEIRVFDLLLNYCDLAVLDAHDGNVYSICTLRGDLFVSGSEDRTLKIWKVMPDQCQCIQTLNGHTGPIHKVIVLSEKRLASGSKDKTIRIWDTNSYSCSKVLDPHTFDVESLIEMKNLKTLVSGADCVRIWKKDFSSSEKIETEFVYSLIEIDYDKVVSGSWVKLHIIDVKTLKIEKVIQNLGLVGAFSFCLLRSKNLVCGDWLGNIHEINIELSKVVAKKKIHDTCINCLIMEEHEKLISASYDSQIKISK